MEIMVIFDSLDKYLLEEGFEVCGRVSEGELPEKIRSFEGEKLIVIPMSFLPRNYRGTIEKKVDYVIFKHYPKPECIELINP